MAHGMAKRRDFGTARKLASGNYQALWWLDGQRQKGPHTFATKSDATAFLATVQADLLRGNWIDPAAGHISFHDFAEQWRSGQVHRPSTSSQIETNLRRHVYPRLGNLPLSSIRASHIQALIKALEGGEDGMALAPSTIGVIYTWVSAILGAAVDDRRIAFTPCLKIRLPEIHRGRVTPLNIETVHELIRAVPERYSALIVLGAGTGVRISEALGLTNDRIDWLRRTVTIDRQLIRSGHSPTFGPVKDKRNRPRTIPLPKTVIDALAAHIKRFGLGPEELLFTGPRGGAVRRSTFSDAWRAAAGPLGVPVGNGYHQLRHFYASVLIKAGESVKTVQEHLGHTSAQMTLDVYAHLWPEDDDCTRSAVDDVLGSRAPRAHRPMKPTNPQVTGPVTVSRPIGGVL